MQIGHECIQSILSLLGDPLDRLVAVLPIHHRLEDDAEAVADRLHRGQRQLRRRHRRADLTVDQDAVDPDLPGPAPVEPHTPGVLVNRANAVVVEEKRVVEAGVTGEAGGLLEGVFQVVSGLVMKSNYFQQKSFSILSKLI